jgi:hypothetical protein
MPCVTELELDVQRTPALLGADGRALERLAAALGVRAGALVADGACRVRLGGALSACAAAECAIWHAAGDVAADEHGWYYLDPAGRLHGPHSSASLAAWWRAGYWPADLPVRNGASTAWMAADWCPADAWRRSAAAGVALRCLGRHGLRRAGGHRRGG